MSGTYSRPCSTRHWRPASPRRSRQSPPHAPAEPGVVIQTSKHMQPPPGQAAEHDSCRASTGTIDKEPLRFEARSGIGQHGGAVQRTIGCGYGPLHHHRRRTRGHGNRCCRGRCARTTRKGRRRQPWAHRHATSPPLRSRPRREPRRGGDGAPRARSPPRAQLALRGGPQRSTHLAPRLRPRAWRGRPDRPALSERAAGRRAGGPGALGVEGARIVDEGAAETKAMREAKPAPRPIPSNATPSCIQLHRSRQHAASASTNGCSRSRASWPTSAITTAVASSSRRAPERARRPQTARVWPSSRPSPLRPRRSARVLKVRLRSQRRPPAGARALVRGTRARPAGGNSPAEGRPESPQALQVGIMAFNGGPPTHRGGERNRPSRLVFVLGHRQADTTTSAGSSHTSVEKKTAAGLGILNTEGAKMRLSVMSFLALEGRRRRALLRNDG